MQVNSYVCNPSGKQAKDTGVITMQSQNFHCISRMNTLKDAMVDNG
ncbi:hypothetical protein UUU_35260 [Klebsiella pneumoniae subsp. pneumoniae DSM 30104 = JCM 1662 = NBRC 14940]|nr:hypothetical protein UUU_35260 [Klebsiella pneumoniae subsp. pneumoniae DSM 30104 = JCM 1662 = NBRC 14940]